jgi:hypothetical protein
MGKLVSNFKCYVHCLKCSPENVVHIYNGGLVGITEEWNDVIWKKINETGNQVEQDNSNSERRVLYVFTHVKSNPKKNPNIMWLKNRYHLRGTSWEWWGKFDQSTFYACL